MQNNRVILGFSVETSGYFAPQSEMGFFLQLKASPGKLSEVVSYLASLSEVMSLYRTGHSYPLLAEIKVESVTAYNSLLQSIYAAQEGLTDTETMLVLEQIVHHPYLFQVI
jgi:DNA-binding Lrp family transcriptional regulator